MIPLPFVALWYGGAIAACTWPVPCSGRACCVGEAAPAIRCQTFHVRVNA